jgi:putative zinc finger/helix-turn-helix YgiT family protein
MECLNCGAAMRVKKAAAVEGTYGGETFTVRATAMACPSCKYATVAAENLDEYARAVADAYRVKHKRLTSGQLVTARRRLGMSQRRFASYLGVGEASIKRWELGKVQDKAMDELVRLKTQAAYAAKNHAFLNMALSRTAIVSGKRG